MPIKTDARSNRVLIWSVGLHIILMFNFLEPFGIKIDSFIPEYHLMLCSYGVVSSLTMALIVYFLYPFLEKKKQQHSQQGINAFLWLACVVFLISFSNWLYSLLLHDLINGWKNMYIVDARFIVLMPKFIILYGIWGIIVLINFFIVNQIQENNAVKPHELEEMMVLHSDNQSDKFKVNELQLVCFKTCDNYLEVYYLDEANVLKNRMIRSSMKKIESQLNASQFYRCHQSYLVNLAYVKGLKKVKNTHFLEMAYVNFDVSISRKNLKNIKTFLVS